MSALTDCPECEGVVRMQSEETVCADCGLVVAEDRIDRGPEWRSFDDDGNQSSRVGAPLTRSRHDRGLSTEIGHDKDVRLTGRKRRRLTRMRRLHNRARIPSKTDRNQVYAFSEVRRLVSGLSLSDDVRDRACVLFESAQKADLIRGRSIEGFAAACVYAVCRTSAISRTLAEVVTHARGDEEELKTAYDAMNRELGLPTGPIDPREYLPRYASRLSLSTSVERTAEAYVEYAESEHLVAGRNPSGIAAACLYAAARDTDERVTQAEAAEAASVTPVTLRSTYSELKDATVEASA